MGIDIDEDWALAVCAVNLLEAAVNKKLEDLNESPEGDFVKKLERLVTAIEREEQRKIQRMMPESLYKVIRHKLDHASHKYKPTRSEADIVVKTVLSFLDDLFPRV